MSLAILKKSEVRKIREYFSPQPGYILDLSKPQFAELLEDELGIDILSDEFNGFGESSEKRLRSYLEIASPYEAGQLLRLLWKEKTREWREEYRRVEALVGLDVESVETLEFRFHKNFLDEDEFESFVGNIERRTETEVLEVIRISARNFNFDTVLREIDRANRNIDTDPEDALTSACALIECVCRSILVELDLPLPRDLSVSTLYKEVRQPLNLHPNTIDIDPLIANDVRSILSNLTGTVEGIGALRTHGGDAHGREKDFARIDARIARLSVYGASAISLFLIETWQEKLPDRELPNADRK